MRAGRAGSDRGSFILYIDIIYITGIISHDKPLMFNVFDTKLPLGSNFFEYGLVTTNQKKRRQLPCAARRGGMYLIDLGILLSCG